MRTTLLILAIIFGAGGIGLAYYHHKTAYSAKDELDRERYSRMTVEEELLKATEKLAALEKEMGTLKTRVENSEKMLNQTMAVKDDLQTKLHEALNEKDSLEQKVRELTQTIKEKMAAASKTGDI